MTKQECPFLSDAGVAYNNASDGIEVCLNCPIYPKPCIYEVTTRSQRKREIRRAQVKVLCMEGKSQRKIAKLLGVSEWTVGNDIKANKEAKDEQVV